MCIEWKGRQKISDNLENAQSQLFDDLRRFLLTKNN